MFSYLGQKQTKCTMKNVITQQGIQKMQYVSSVIFLLWLRKNLFSAQLQDEPQVLEQKRHAVTSVD